MQYHEADIRWSIFGCKDYNTYLELFLVKGLFHNKVPEDIRKEYETIEQLMAHAWYHYPMYDEAMNKLLRTFEIAIKLKCKELFIPLAFINKKNEKQKHRLADLIKLIHERERGKKLKIFLSHLKDLRNTFMHPDQSSYMGGMHYSKIILSINILNILFADEPFLIELEQRQDQLRIELSRFSNRTLGFQRGNERYLVHNLSFGDAFKVGDDETLLLAIDTVAKFEEGTEPRRQWVRPLFVEVKNPKIETNSISGTDLLSGSQFSLFINDHPSDVSKAEAFRKEIHKITLPGSELNFPEAQYNPQLTLTIHEKSREMQKFRYRYYHLIK